MIGKNGKKLSNEKAARVIEIKNEIHSMWVAAGRPTAYTEIQRINQAATAIVDARRAAVLPRSPRPSRPHGLGHGGFGH